MKANMTLCSVPFGAAFSVVISGSFQTERLFPKPLAIHLLTPRTRSEMRRIGVEDNSRKMVIAETGRAGAKGKNPRRQAATPV